ncbi:homeobox protein engrailed-1-like [Cuculus canorus]|uniref:homeobox protein engrailed-1-like n=1 Tax=Cuculus canorus TaxID=55661 RepID=UPI0023AAEE41|nr:homeobox protein engrailed-1-like [Cuculus canorus]
MGSSVQTGVSAPTGSSVQGGSSAPAAPLRPAPPGHSLPRPSPAPPGPPPVSRRRPHSGPGTAEGRGAPGPDRSALQPPQHVARPRRGGITAAAAAAGGGAAAGTERGGVGAGKPPVLSGAPQPARDRGCRPLHLLLPDRPVPARSLRFICCRLTARCQPGDSGSSVAA